MRIDFFRPTQIFRELIFREITPLTSKNTEHLNSQVIRFIPRLISALFAAAGRLCFIYFSSYWLSSAVYFSTFRILFLCHACFSFNLYFLTILPFCVYNTHTHTHTHTRTHTHAHTHTHTHTHTNTHTHTHLICIFIHS